MASISPPTFRTSDTNPLKSTFISSRFSSLHHLPLKPSSLQFYSHSLSKTNDSSLFRCHSQSADSPSSSGKRWDSAIQDVVKNALKRIDEYFNSYKDKPKDGYGGVADRVSEVGLEKEDDENWDWHRWSMHFKEIDEQERIVSILKLQLSQAINREDYEGAARLKVAIAAAATNDAVGKVISQFNRAIVEERYNDAALIRDYASAGLVGWWAGISEDTNDPYGRIIRITAEHGRYVARSYSPRQLASATGGAPLFEVFLTTDKKGEYKQQAVYLKMRQVSEDSPIMSSRSTSTTTTRLKTLDSTEDISDLMAISTEEEEEDVEDVEDRNDDSDIVKEELSGFQNIIRDMIPGVKVKVVKATVPGKGNRDMIFKLLDEEEDEEEQEDDEKKDSDLEIVETDDESKIENSVKLDEIELDINGGIIDVEEEEDEKYGITVKFGGTLVKNLSSNIPSKDLLRVPARLQKKGRFSFSFAIEKNGNSQEIGDKEESLISKKRKVRGQRNIDKVTSDLAKLVGTEKIPMKVLKDISELIHFTLSEAQNYQPLTDSTTFNRLELPPSSDPLNGLYIGAHGLYTSEVIQLRHKYGQWQDSGTKEPSNLEFYEYVEAVKLTGDPYVPAGQVAFRAKVGKRNQLPHKGIIPKEFGVIARYKGQGRLAEPGFRNPRWVDGELVILDGKYIKQGPVVGFVYWAPEQHFLVFYNRLRLQE